MRSSGSRTFSFISGILIGMLAAVGLIFLIMNQYNPANLFYRTDSTSSSDTIVDMRQLKTARKSRSDKTVNKQSQPEIVEDSAEGETQIEESDPIIIKRDEFIKSFDLKVNLLDDSQQNKRDSLINKLQDGASFETFRLDLFLSPIKFNGYRLTGRIITAYGLDENLNYKLYKYRSSYYLKSGKQVFRMVENDDYEPFDAVTDPTLINLFAQ